MTSELVSHSTCALSDVFRCDSDARFSSCAPLETDRPFAPYQLEEPSSPTNPLLTSRVALQAPPSDSNIRRKLVALSVSRPRAVLTCNARDASSRLGEELEVETPRRLSSCITRYENPFERSYLNRSLLFGTNRLLTTAHRFALANLACRVNAECELHFG